MADVAPAVSPFPAAPPFPQTTHNPDVARVGALTKLIANKKAQITANAKVVTPQVLARFQAQVDQAQAELDATLPKVAALASKS